MQCQEDNWRWGQHKHIKEKEQHQRSEVSDTSAPFLPHPAQVLPPADNAGWSRPLCVITGWAGEAGRWSQCLYLQEKPCTSGGSARSAWTVKIYSCWLKNTRNKCMGLEIMDNYILINVVLLIWMSQFKCHLNELYFMVRRTYSSLCFSVLNVLFLLTLLILI